VMSLPVLLAFAGVLVAAAVTGVIAGRCVRAPSALLGVWTVAAAGLAIAAAAEAVGFASGFGPITFRAVQIGAQLIAPLWLAWGLAELTAGEAVRFGARLAGIAVTVVTGLILATDTLSGQAFGKSWPSAASHYQSVSHYVLVLAQLVAVGGAVAFAAFAVLRARSGVAGPATTTAQVVVPVAAAVVVSVCLRFSLPARSAYPLLTGVAAGLVWFGVSKSGVGVARSGPQGRDGSRSSQGRADSPDRGGPGGPASPRDPGWRGGYDQRDRAGAGRGAYGPDHSGQGAGQGHGGPGYGAYRPGYGEWTGPGGARGFAPPAGPGGYPPPAPVLVEESGPLAAGGGPPPAASPPARPYGRLVILTLLDDRAAEFDRLAERTAEEVRTGEPDTLVYVIHLVPNAPLQRIFYEIYRDRAAFDRHEDKAYNKRFVADRRAYVLATNVIELRVKYAKVAPLPQVEPASTARAQLPSGVQRSLPAGAGPLGGALAAGLTGLPSAVAPPMGASMPNPLPPPAPVAPPAQSRSASQRHGGR
jgi:quinol monooxygenase YgiN